MSVKRDDLLDAARAVRVAQRGGQQPGAEVDPLRRGVRPPRAGVGRALLEHLARLAVERDYGRIEWAALDWNAPALDFYAGLGARPVEGWTIHRLGADGIRDLAVTDGGAAPA